MVTSSFERPFVIRDDKAAQAMIVAMENPQGHLYSEGTEFEEALERGRLLLEELRSHCEKSSERSTKARL